MRETDRQIGWEGRNEETGSHMEETEVERREGGGGGHCDWRGSNEGGTLVHSYRYTGMRGT